MPNYFNLGIDLSTELGIQVTVEKRPVPVHWYREATWLDTTRFYIDGLEGNHPEVRGRFEALVPVLIAHGNARGNDPDADKAFDRAYKDFVRAYERASLAIAKLLALPILIDHSVQQAGFDCPAHVELMSSESVNCVFADHILLYEGTPVDVWVEVTPEYLELNA